jgi:hypothetical protein
MRRRLVIYLLGKLFLMIARLLALKGEVHGVVAFAQALQRHDGFDLGP